MRIFVYPYSSGSESAKLLATALGAKRIKLTNSSYQYRPDDLIVNWGNTKCPYPSLNPAHALQRTVNKLSCFRVLRGAGLSGIPDYWTDAADIPNHAFPVFCRQRLEGCDGAGVVLARSRDELVDANLYTKRVYGTEYRVTVFKGEVTDIQTKLPRQGVEILDEEIKTYVNGWGFQRKPVHPDIEEIISDLAIDALAMTGLDFGGCDIVYDDQLNRAFLLEINSAMGIEGGALDRFADAVLRYKNELELAAEAEAIYGGACTTSAPINLPDGASLAILEAVQKEDWKTVVFLAAQKAVSA